MIVRDIDVTKPLTKEQREMLEKADKMPITFDEDSPELTEEDLKHFYRAKDGKPVDFQNESEDITLRVPAWVLGKARALGKAADPSFFVRVLENAMRNNKIIEESL